jgi:peptidoglycan/xylan/chitin deacetylase (PgdA/CDA1 family)
MSSRARSTGTLVVLAYHAIADSGADQVLRRYSVPPGRFVRQLEALIAAGWQFIDADALLEVVVGERQPPRRAALVTFDDGYGDFACAAVPELTRLGIPAVVFVLPESLGMTNSWDERIGAATMRLMDPDVLRRVAGLGIEIGSHGMSHRSMTALEPNAVAGEMRESAAALDALGLGRPRLFAYPYGDCPPAAQAAARDAGYAAAFSITPGVVTRGSNLYALPRLQVLRGYRPIVLRLKIALARYSWQWLERLFDVIGRRG